ncbi:outer membrane beta-barrel protein [Mangrovimonas sp. TPBH4]|uniref:outer membrane beta-barrel protein n=1 Tax=Mangrovimonas sp. TPBH4 TaxID=1645914 RepID=UPI0018D0162B|nr:outer membrane beta-barrel protein [Mangrovimonas sp. TPBH4]
MDWRKNPTEFTYKLSEDSDLKTGNLKNFLEFGVYNTVKFLRHTINIDFSSESISYLDYKREPNFEKKEVFLKILLDGHASLYQYVDGGITRYFFKTNDNSTEQLIYKKYIDSNNAIKENMEFKQQLWNSLKCATITIEQIKKLDYNQKDLLNFFIAYNQCIDPTYKIIDQKRKKDLFNLSIKGRVNNVSLMTNSSNFEFGNPEFNDKIIFGFGLEAEIFLPFNKNKWSIFVEPTLEKYKNKNTFETTSVSTGKVKLLVDYTSIELPIGLRYHLYLNKNSKLFLNAGAILNFSSNNSQVEFELDHGTYPSIEINPSSNFCFGIGYTLANKYSLELRYSTNKDILSRPSWNTEYESLSCIFGYSIL